MTYKHLNAGTAAEETKLLGRCWDKDFAEQLARDQYKSPEYEILDIRIETDFEKARHKIFRVIIRTLRIMVAGIITFFAVSWLQNNGVKIGDVPIADLTIGMIFSALIYLAIFVGVTALCWEIAFGDGPQDN